MDLLPPICCSCRHGLVIPALVAASRQAVFWCRRDIVSPPSRDACPGFEREMTREEERTRTRG
jgi:hypothetical protein